MFPTKNLAWLITDTDTGFRVVPYSSRFAKAWEEVLGDAPNATILHRRSYLEYHRDRFRDVSVVIFANERPMAVFPAHQKGSNVYSHQGLSYAGLIHRRCSFHQTLQLYRYLLEYYWKQGFSLLSINAIPMVYTSEPGDPFPYLMHLAGAETVGMKLTQAVLLPLAIRHKGRRSAIRRAREAGLEIRLQEEVDEFWDALLVPNLQNRYGKKPTHTREEMRYLKSMHPNCIHQYTAFENGNPVAGATVYETPNCLHTQYLATSSRGRELHAMDLLVYHLATEVGREKRYLDFGHSHWPEGGAINWSLFRWKQSFGAKPFPQVNYRLRTSAWRQLDADFLNIS
jgi:hypothetical protein